MSPQPLCVALSESWSLQGTPHKPCFSRFPDHCFMGAFYNHNKNYTGWPSHSTSSGQGKCLCGPSTNIKAHLNVHRHSQLIEPQNTHSLKLFVRYALKGQDILKWLFWYSYHGLLLVTQSFLNISNTYPSYFCFLFNFQVIYKTKIYTQAIKLTLSTVIISV